jgi:hypothetical protein
LEARSGELKLFRTLENVNICTFFLIFFSFLLLEKAHRRGEQAKIVNTEKFPLYWESRFSFDLAGLSVWKAKRDPFEAVNFPQLFLLNILHLGRQIFHSDLFSMMAFIFGVLRFKNTIKVGEESFIYFVVVVVVGSSINIYGKRFRTGTSTLENFINKKLLSLSSTRTMITIITRQITIIISLVLKIYESL